MTEVVPSSALSEVSLRLLCHDDIDTVKHLCGDWFPIEYPDSWYRDITSNKKFFSLAATYRGAIVGMIVAEIKNRTKIHKEALQLPFLLLETSASAAALALPTCACTVPRADPVWLHSLGGGCPHRASPTLLPVPAAPSCKARGDFLLQGRNTSITDTLDRKGTGASEQGGAIKGMPHPPPEPAQRSLGGGEWPPVLHEGLMRGGQPGGGFPRKHRALRLSPPAQAVTRLDGSCSLAPSVQFPVPWGHAAHWTMACPVQLTC
uniref:histone acetyltransferase n=1 Tax=Macaca fascicularis TaxID=9541 RepID=A0A7N9CQJ6_MACFA